MSVCADDCLSMKLFSRFGRVGCISPSAEYVTVNQEMEKLIPATTAFGFSLLQECRKENPNGNILFSPFSISTILAMMASGANGSSKTQILNVLNMSDVADGELEQIYHSILKDKVPDRCTLKIANGIFVDKFYELSDSYTKTIKENFDAKLKNMDFSEKFEEAEKVINNWAKDATGKKVKNFLDPGTIDNITRLILINAIYFKGSWKQKFDPQRTFRSPFHVSSSETTEIDMMHVTSEFNYSMSHELQCSCVELPYLGDRRSMVIILPDEIDGIGQLEAKLNMDVMNMLVRSMIRRSDIQLYLPKFKVETTLNLPSQLSSLGATDLFSDNCDLSGVTDTTGLKVSDFIHKSVVEVNEEGNDTAANSGSMIRFVCAVIPTEIVVNHPFLMFIRDFKTGNILFMGSIRKL